ncbi:DNA-binding transcriptional regulator, XRE-family HTH domain [Hespellia stercorisuis DSM 15480]|uniref:DNA-binding transcriptional regulator, XRE-family HTH domain n=1 Tax=Hespellia stercorisuis DSM 15480 TaxID=1121950 RepID=A0A1M6VGB8_9FIRM|nr:DNA-binding transcriptional regulator, XRE-family HTH domain [Hespellia stercorisuis DSM 15480]
MVNEERRIRVGYRIKECREEMKMSQSALSEKANVSRTIISGLENGSITVTTTETLFKIANALNKKVSDIFLD